MADSSIGRSDPLIRSTTMLERAGTATDRQPQRRERQDRRDKEKDGTRRRRIHDLLFEEIDQIDALEPRQRERVKRNIRSHFASAAPATPPRYGQAPAHAADADAGWPHAPPAGEPLEDPGDGTGGDHDPDPEGDADRLLRDIEAPLSVDEEQFLQVAAPLHPHLPPADAEENARLARQLRDCLAQQTERARKIAVYLHLLLALHGATRPRFVLDV
ncbi:hypothetical protein [Azospirillum sp. A39]|uniref:hypothetical protein n=1 Tax=Azospirillum sp. A39 TaxID=3462279 RepID=UPI0040459BB1